ncbi:MAG: hypothetical protein IJN03_02995 [Bacilli bacterium]|nr:hypothetical protein [Bacilli bacterium]
MIKFIKNPAFEFIYNENDTVTIFDEDMTVIHSLDDIGKIILEFFNKEIAEEFLKLELCKIFNNINHDELNDFLNELKEKQIIISVQ